MAVKDKATSYLQEAVSVAEAMPPVSFPVPYSLNSLSSVFEAFTADSQTTLDVFIGRDKVVESWTGEKGVTGLQEIPGLAGYPADEFELEAVMSEGSYIGITEVRQLADICRCVFHVSIHTLQQFSNEHTVGDDLESPIIWK